MTKWLQTKLALICAVCLLCALTSGYVSVDRDAGVGAYEKMPVYVDGVLEYTGYRVDGVVYVPLRSFFSALNMGAVVTWNSDTGTMYVSFEEAIVTETVVDMEMNVTPVPAATPSPNPGELETVVVQQTVTETVYRPHTLWAQVGQFYLYVNDRVIYLGADVLDDRGNILVPLDGLCSAFGLTVAHDRDGVTLDTRELKVCETGSEVYDSEDLYWLSRIINAEAGNQSMVGQICVGNVVLNRAASEKFPNTVKEVVFSPNQFCPVKSGTIYCTPDDDAITAAKLCLEGVSMAGESTYFVNPSTGVTTWFRNHLTFYGTVEDHDFYY